MVSGVTPEVPMTGRTPASRAASTRPGVNSAFVKSTTTSGVTIEKSVCGSEPTG
jgi:hypothetical protein